MANSAFDRLKRSVWLRRDISVKLKLRLYSALILPIAIYGSETCSLTQLDAKKLSVFRNNCLRAILNIRLQDYVSIDEIRKSTKQHNSIENIIRKGRLTWFGNICRLNDEILRKRMTKEDFNKRNRGRPKKRSIDLNKKDTRLPVATTKKYAQDRKKCRNNVNTKWVKPLSGVCN